MLKNYALFTCFLLFYVIGVSQSPTWQWAKGPVGHGAGAEGNSVATDKQGNVYVAGSNESDSLDFDNILLLGELRVSFFVAKYSPTGQVIWVKGSSLAGYSEGLNIALDNDGNVYVTGIYFGTDSISFDNITTTRSADSVRYAMFLVKYDSSGNALWAHSTPVCYTARLQYPVTTDNENNVYVTGGFQVATCVFGAYTLTNPSTQAFYNYFIAKYSPNGQVLWAQSAVPNSYSDVSPGGIYTDSYNNVYVAGSFQSYSLGLGGITLHEFGSSDIVNGFVVKYDSVGNVLWAKATNGECGIEGISGDLNGNTFITGYFLGDSMVFDTQIMRGALNSQSDSMKMFVIKYNPDANGIWAKNTSGFSSTNGFSIANDIDGNVYVAGEFTGRSVVFDSVTLLRPAGSTDPMLLLTIDPNGNLLCSTALQSGGAGTAQIGGVGTNSICTDKHANAYITGSFEAINLKIGSDTLLYSGTDNLFIARFHCGTINNIPLLASNSATLQLHPNPFTTQATVQYSLPNGSKNASLIIYDILGRERSSYQLTNTNGELTINANNLSSGVYLYSLMVDGRVLVTKKMVVDN